MRTEHVNIYKIDELSEKAKERAHYDYLSNGDFYFWGDENAETLKRFTDIFPVKVRNYSYGNGGNDYIKYDIETQWLNNDVSELTGVRLLKYIVNQYWRYLFRPKCYTTNGYYDNNNKYHYKKRYSNCTYDNSCVLTGYCMDDEILKPIYDFLKRPDKYTTFEDLLKECLENWLSECNKDIEAAQTMEAFIEHSRANEYEYYDNGEMY